MGPPKKIVINTNFPLTMRNLDYTEQIYSLLLLMNWLVVPSDYPWDEIHNVAFTSLRVNLDKVSFMDGKHNV